MARTIHAERLRASAFKLLMSALRNNYWKLVPYEAHKNLLPEQVELILFLEKVLAKLPILSLDARQKTVTSNNNRNDKFYYLFGFHSYNKELRKSVMEDPLLRFPIFLLTRYYKDIKSKFKGEFLEIFQEFASQCAKAANTTSSVYPESGVVYNEDYESNSNLSGNITKSRASGKGNTYEALEDSKITKFKNFIQNYSLSEEVVEQALEFLDRDDLENVFFTLVRNIEVPLSVQTLANCFDLYKTLLVEKHSRSVNVPSNSNEMYSQQNTQQKMVYYQNAPNTCYVQPNMPAKQRVQSSRRVIKTEANLQKTAALLEIKREHDSDKECEEKTSPSSDGSLVPSEGDDYPYMNGIANQQEGVFDFFDEAQIEQSREPEIFPNGDEMWSANQFYNQFQQGQYELPLFEENRKLLEEEIELPVDFLNQQVPQMAYLDPNNLEPNVLDILLGAGQLSAQDQQFLMNPMQFSS